MSEKRRARQEAERLASREQLEAALAPYLETRLFRTAPPGIDRRDPQTAPVAAPSPQWTQQLRTTPRRRAAS